MKRSELRRYTPLTAKSELKRTTALGRSLLARSALHADSAGRQQPKRTPARNTGPSAKVRALVRARSGGWCEAAGCWLVATQIHHRKPRRMGGSTDPAVNRASNLLDLCSTSHQYTESHRREALANGVLLHASQAPRSVPVLTRHGLVLLDDAGTFTVINPTQEEPMAVCRFRKKPVEITAVQWDGDNVEELRDFTEGRFDALDEDDLANSDDPEATAQVFDVLHSTWVLVQTGDWIIRGVQGEFYPCRSDVFAATYDAVAA